MLKNILIVAQRISDDQKKRLVKRLEENMESFLHDFLPTGRLKGNYWRDPTHEIRVSIRTGNIFHLEEQKSRNPIGDVFDLYMFTQEKGFRQAFKEMSRWCDVIESKQEGARRPERDYLKHYTEIKSVVFAVVFEVGGPLSYRASARNFWKQLKEACDFKAFKKEYPEVETATGFLELLHFWTEERSYFTVTEKSRSKKTEFVLAVPDQETLKANWKALDSA
jgi:hypothetical protein